MNDQEQVQVQDPAKDTIILSTGVVLELLDPSPILVTSLMQASAAEEPKPPKVFIANKDREEENFSDPDYVAALRLWYANSGMRAIQALLPTGSRIESKPEDMAGPEDAEFADLMEMQGQQLGKSKYSRYSQWVLLYAVRPPDLQPLGDSLMRHAGVREEDVREAQKLFQGLEERRVNNDSPPEGGGEHGNNLPASSPESGAGD